VTDSRENTLLIVEDEILILDLAVMALEEHDPTANIVSASNVQQALERLDNMENLDALVTDIQMPGDKDGLDLAIYVNSRFPGCAIILVSGRPLPTDRPAPKGSRYVPKPWIPSDLIRVIEHEIGAKRSIA